jgi:hypothetical protein
MELDRKANSGSSATVFIAGVIIGGIGGGLAGWLLGGHIAPILTSLFHLLGRDNDRQSVRFEALQQ